jgi:hypothetical protein
VFLSHLPIDIAVVIWRLHDGSETIAIAPRVRTQCYPIRCSRGPGVSNPSLQTFSEGAHAGLQLVVVNAGTDSDLEPASATRV